MGQDQPTLQIPCSFMCNILISEIIHFRFVRCLEHTVFGYFYKPPFTCQQSSPLLGLFREVQGRLARGSHHPSHTNITTLKPKWLTHGHNDTFTSTWTTHLWFSLIPHSLSQIHRTPEENQQGPLVSQREPSSRPKFWKIKHRVGPL